MIYSLPFSISLEWADDLLRVVQVEFDFDPSETSRARRLIESGLPPLVRPDMLPFLLGVSYSLILSMARFPETHYRIYTVAKASGGTRQIEAPRQFLKIIQKWIYVHILAKTQLPPQVTGFVRGMNIFSNAKAHLPSRNVMVVDIEDFFPSVTERNVREIFREYGFPIKVANRLAGLCTYESRLPQGAPTSPALANIAFSPTDERLMHLAREWGCVYTRYADDLAFSGERRFSRQDMDEIAHILELSGFGVNYKKSRIVGSGSRQIVAGLLVNEKGLPPRVKRMRWRATFHQAGLYPTKYVGQSSHLKGIASFVNEYNSELARKYWYIANQVAHQE